MGLQLNKFAQEKISTIVDFVQTHRVLILGCTYIACITILYQISGTFGKVNLTNYLMHFVGLELNKFAPEKISRSVGFAVMANSHRVLFMYLGAYFASKYCIKHQALSVRQIVDLHLFMYPEKTTQFLT